MDFSAVVAPPSATKFPLDALVGCRVSQAPIRAEELRSFQECFLSSTTREIAPVRVIDDIPCSVAADSLSRKLAGAFRDFASGQIALQRELRFGERPRRVASAETMQLKRGSATVPVAPVGVPPAG